MVSQGIYTLANDVVFDQLVALLNSIETNVGNYFQVCVIPYDDKLDLVNKELKSRPNVTLFDDQESFKKWDEFADKIWSAHPRSKQSKYSRTKWYKGSLHRKFASFDGTFDQFAFYEGDTLAMKPLNRLFELLQSYDFVFDDWEHNKPIESTAINISLIEKATSYREEDIRPLLHDASFFGAKKGLFSQDFLEQLTQKLINEKEVEWINEIGWWDDVFLFNYLTFRLERPIFNFTLSPNKQEVTGNCAEVDPFINIDNVLYNEQGSKPIHRIHYMKYSSRDFAGLCQGIDADIRYKDIFLHYRFLKAPEQQPTQLRPPHPLSKVSGQFQKVMDKVKRLQRD
jgi:hypothetical protein